MNHCMNFNGTFKITTLRTYQPDSRWLPQQADLKYTALTVLQKRAKSQCGSS